MGFLNPSNHSSGCINGLIHQRFICYLIMRTQLNTYAQCLLYLTACIQLDMRKQTAVKFQQRQEVKPDGVSVGG